MAWDIAVKTKVYHLLANEIFFRIYNGTYPPGVKLSSFPVFAKEVLKLLEKLYMNYRSTVL